MSGIAGIVYFNSKSPSRELISNIKEKLSVRGPDRQQEWVEDNCALIHTMLWTTPESLTETLPYHDPISELVITADARIDNRIELANRLGISSCELRDASDSRLILMSFKKWGKDCPKYLIGDFAFAIWNNKTKELFCARDHMSVKPFFYYINDDFFIFASEIKALLCEVEIAVSYTHLTLPTNREV